MLPLDHVRSTDPPWVHLCVLPAGQTPRALADPPPRFFIARIEGRRCATKAGLLSEFARALDFPSYFGNNWDAFEECLTDLSWAPAAGYLIVVTDAEQVLAGADAEYATFIDTLQAAARDWATTRSVPFHVVLAVSEPHATARADWRLPRLTG